MKKLLTILCLAVVMSAPVSAAVITETTSPIVSSWFQDYGSGTHYDTDTNLEWLDFANGGVSQTLGMSINTAEAAYASQNFRLATSTEVTNLFNNFFPTFTDDGGDTMAVPEGDGTSYLIEARNSWLFSFGYTIDGVVGADGTVQVQPGETIRSNGMYLDDNSLVGSFMGIKIGTTPNINTTLFGPDYNFGVSRTTNGPDFGVFMVRDYNPTVVPIPAAVWLFCTGLLGLVAVARRKAS